MSVARSRGLTMLLGGVLSVATACGSGGNSGPASTSSSPAAQSSSVAATPTTTAAGSAPLGDYTYLLIQASDVGPDFTPVGAPVQNPGDAAGAGQSFGNPNRTRTVNDTVFVSIDPTVALQSESDYLAAFPKYVASAPQPLEIGSNGWIGVGKSPDKSKAVTYLVFAEGKAVVTIEFDSATDDPVPQDLVLDVARKQDGAVKSRLLI
ncbi:hypothetical protein [Mycobacterium shigaense]|uniref:Uncharacterized protein n=1 Tax=Mycobacterium shigaense TaxID=722731 RepID=A0A1Z4EJC2_9MYCO|nr:hypothetical protein [Mycobacterium shigaense]MEA1125032.1 hypothetical protein [Mycobacterium shigaense]PRI13897.1 hypothetical protein B2J96_19920 [Mycobacterium shigaense]BAX93058.1 hypothetical protein MSG_02915 [Mycobacterium shigaense]